jgi:hypothetical protein
LNRFAYFVQQGINYLLTIYLLFPYYFLTYLLTIYLLAYLKTTFFSAATLRWTDREVRQERWGGRECGTKKGNKHGGARGDEEIIWWR